MRILYIASGIRVPGAFGGAIHTHEVAQGLAQRGHELHVVVRPPEGTRQWPWQLARHTDQQGLTWYSIDLPKALSLLAYPLIQRLVKRLNPDIVMERYYNLAGTGIAAAAKYKRPTILEVNALIVDPPAIRKRQIDDMLGRVLLGSTHGPLRRWAVWQCQHSARIVTPLHTTVPPEIARERISEMPWGANTTAFEPQISAAEPPTFVFLGSFRHWHGVTDFVQAATQLLDQNIQAHFLLIGDGPEQAAAQALAGKHQPHFTWTGAVAHDKVPALLASATIGVAPFNPARHPALLAAGFFWSPLKIYEYMAAGLPVITANIAPLDTIIRPGQEGELFEPNNIESLSQAMLNVLRSPERQAMGQRARQRVMAHYSWAAHCTELEQIMQAII